MNKGLILVRKNLTATGLEKDINHIEASDIADSSKPFNEASYVIFIDNDRKIRFLKNRDDSIILLSKKDIDMAIEYNSRSYKEDLLWINESDIQ